MKICTTPLIERIGGKASAALGCAIPVSVAADNLLLFLILCCWLAGRDYRTKWLAIRHHPVSLAALALFITLAAGITWAADRHAAVSTALKYLDLLFIPLFIHYFRDPANRRFGLMLFSGTMILTLLISIFLKTGVILQTDLLAGSMNSPVVFKFRITHGFLMAFAAFLFAWMAIAAPEERRDRLLWTVLSALACFNVLFMVEGATGYLTLAALISLIAITRFSKKVLFIFVLILPVTIAATLIVDNPLSRRAAQFSQEMQNWKPGIGQRDSSLGLRLEFFRNTASIIAENPLHGVGTGGFAKAYASHVAGTDMLATTNPHNEYLMIAAQTGIIGLGAFLFLLAIQWRTSVSLPSAVDVNLARGLVIAMAIGCLFNSFLLDHAEGLFFAWISGLLFAGYRSDTPTGQSA